MPRKKTEATNLKQSQFSVPRRSLEIDVNIDQFLSIVCNTSRRHILELLAEPNEDDPSIPTERRSGEIARALGLSTATTSEHLHLLANLQLVMTRKESTVVYYRLADNVPVRAFLEFLQALERYYQEH